MQDATRWRSVLRAGLVATLCAAGSGAPALAQQNGSQLVEPLYRVHRDAMVVPVEHSQPPQQQSQEHPLMPAIRLAKASLSQIDNNIHDYSCTLVKRENIDGKLGDYEYIFTKVRHRPFSVYMYFLGPDHVKGRECIYVAGANDNKLVAHEGGGRLKAILPTVRVDPEGVLAMRGQRYPITEVGFRTLTQRLIEVAEQDSKFGECEVKFFKGAKINGRTCTCLQVVHPVPRQNFRFHLARVFIDDELQVPIRFESYDWPKVPGEAPVLLEEYTYMNLKINNGFTDADFDERNQDYNFH